MRSTQWSLPKGWPGGQPRRRSAFRCTCAWWTAAAQARIRTCGPGWWRPGRDTVARRTARSRERSERSVRRSARRTLTASFPRVPVHAGRPCCRASDAAGGTERHRRHDAVAFRTGCVRADLVGCAFREQGPVDDEPDVHQQRDRRQRSQADLQDEVRHGDGQDAEGDLRADGDDHGCLQARSEEHTSELQSQFHLVCRLLLEKKKKTNKSVTHLKTKNIKQI